jgi:hypothetical protein
MALAPQIARVQPGKTTRLTGARSWSLRLQTELIPGLIHQFFEAIHLGAN